MTHPEHGRSSEPFNPVISVNGRDIETLAARHERLVLAAESAVSGNKQRMQQMTRAACLERLRAELRGKA